jgi:Ca2+-binding RTX toxin-like protein
VSATTGEAAAMTVVAGSNTDLVMNDHATSLTANLGGGQNWLYEASSASHANIYVAGSATTGAVGGAIINAARGDVTNVTLGTDAFLNIVTGPTTNIIATSVSGSGYDFIDIAKATAASLASVATIAATVTGAQNVELYILNTGNAFINAESSDVVVMPGSTGNTTLYGGTGADTVIGGTGYFQGGSGGANLLISSTLAGSTTMIGGSGDYSDTLLSYAGSNLLQGGSGSDLIWDAASAGDTLISSGGTDTIWGSASGNNTIGFGSATTDAFGDLNNSSASANIYFQDQASGTDYIFDFKTGSDTFNLSLGVGASTSLTVSSLTVSGSNTDVTLSDGTKIVFVNNTTVTNSSFTN